MGPHPLWLAESLLQVAAIAPGSRVLDLGCGKALTSIFLARERGVQVWAADLWVPAADNQERVEAAGLQQSIFPIHCEAHALPFASGFFDAVVSFDAFQYFATDDLYLGYLSRFIRPGGLLGIVVPGLAAELEEVPEWLLDWWEPDFWSFHSPAWWRRHWSHGQLVRVETADRIPDGWQLWLDWLRTCLSLDLPPLWPGSDRGVGEAAALERDRGRTLGFTRLAAVRA